MLSGLISDIRTADHNFLNFKAGFHMLATIAVIAGKNVQQSLRSCGNHFLAIVAITANIWKPAYMETAQRSESQRPLNFFGSDRSDHMETSLNCVFGMFT